MMFEKIDDAPDVAADNGAGFENELARARPFGERLHDHLPLFAVLVAVVALFFGLHGGGAVVLGLGGAHVVAVFVLMAVARFRSRGAQ